MPTRPRLHHDLVLAVRHRVQTLVEEDLVIARAAVDDVGQTVVADKVTSSPLPPKIVSASRSSPDANTTVSSPPPARTTSRPSWRSIVSSPPRPRISSSPGRAGDDVGLPRPSALAAAAGDVLGQDRTAEQHHRRRDRESQHHVPNHVVTPLRGRPEARGPSAASVPSPRLERVLDLAVLDPVDARIEQDLVLAGTTVDNVLAFAAVSHVDRVVPLAAEDPVGVG